MTITTQDLPKILEDHRLWLANKGGSKANLYEADLSGANLSRADLSGANLYGANLCGARLSGANLCGASLSRANLYGANLYGANLCGADLYGADLSRANLCGANLSGADLSRADLSGANLSGANLSRANLSRADLSGANLCGANLCGANLCGAKIDDSPESKRAIAKTRILAEGTLIGWKKCLGDIIVKLSIPAEARRSHAFGRKCRAEFVDVLEVLGGSVGTSSHNSAVQYTVGSRVTAHNWCDDWKQECAAGIHFFITREEAEAYDFT